MTKLLKLTNKEGKIILLGTESIISVERAETTDINGNKNTYTKIDSRGAMVSRFYVKESVEEIYEQSK